MLGDFRRLGRQNPPSVREYLLPVATAAAVGAALSAIALGTRSLWLDEGSTYAIASQHGSALWHGIRGDGGNMLAYYLLMHVVIGWFGDAAWVMRLPSVVATAATGGLLAAVGLRLFPGNRRLAAAAGLLVTVSLPLVFWGQNARGYAWLVALSVGSFLAFAAILQTPADRAPSRAATAGYILTTVAALYVGYDAALMIPAQLALLLLFRNRARHVIGCLALTLLLCVPLLVLAAERGSGQLFWVTPLNASIAGDAALTLLSASLPPDFHRTATTAATTAVMGLAVVAAITVAVRAAIRGWVAAARTSSATAAEEALPVIFVLAWVLVPTVLTLAAYAAGEPIELPRVTILEMPALALLLGWLLTQATGTPPTGTQATGTRPTGTRATGRSWLGLAGIAILLALRLLQVIPSYGVSPEPWNRATAYVIRSTPATGHACVAFYAQDGRETFDYYLRNSRLPNTANAARNLRPVLPSLPWNTVRPYVEDYHAIDAIHIPRSRIAVECPRLWLIASHDGQADGTRQSRIDLRRYYRLEHQLALIYRRGHTTLRSLGWASPIHVRLFYR